MPINEFYMKKSEPKTDLNNTETHKNIINNNIKSKEFKFNPMNLNKLSEKTNKLNSTTLSSKQQQQQYYTKINESPSGGTTIKLINPATTTTTTTPANNNNNKKSSTPNNNFFKLNSKSKFKSENLNSTSAADRIITNLLHTTKDSGKISKRNGDKSKKISAFSMQVSVEQFRR